MVHRLRLKQRLFIQKYIQYNGNGTQAALESYDVKNANVAHSIASENLRKPTVREAIEEALLAQGLTPDRIAGEIRHLATAKVPKITADVKLRSIVEILKLTGAYPTQKHANVNLSVKANLSNMKYEDLEKEMTRIDSELHELVDRGIPPKTT